MSIENNLLGMAETRPYGRGFLSCASVKGFAVPRKKNELEVRAFFICFADFRIKIFN